MRITMLVAAIAAAVLGLSSPAGAKGPIAGTIEGDGMAAPIELLGEGTGGASLIDETGFFAATYGQEPEPLSSRAPTGDLGPNLVVTWSLPSSPTDAYPIRQLVYPYARGGPLVYTAAGQPFQGAEQTAGGWFRAPASLVTTLQALGVPTRAELVAAATASASARARAGAASIGAPTDDSSRWPALAIVASASFALLLTGLRPLARRRAAVTAPVEGRPPEDAAFVRRAKEGDVDAYAQLVRLHQGAARRLALAESLQPIE